MVQHSSGMCNLLPAGPCHTKPSSLCCTSVRPFCASMFHVSIYMCRLCVLELVYISRLLPTCVALHKALLLC